MKKYISFFAAIFGFSLAAHAQATSSANQSLALSLSNAIAITFVSSGTSTGASVSIPFVTTSDYTNGVNSAPQQLKIQSNKNFNVTLNASTANFSYTGSASPAPVMPVSGVLAAEVTANGTSGTIASAFNSSYGSITTSAQSLIANCINGGNQTFSIQYQATPGFAYPAGTYTANILYTASQP